MTFSEEFSKQWESLTDYIVSKMIENKNSLKVIEVSELERLLSNEKKRWCVPGQYNAIWLDKLRSKDPETAEMLVAELSSFELSPFQTENAPNSWLYMAGATVGGSAVGFGASKLFTFSTVLSAAAVIGLGAVGFGIGKEYVKQKKHDAVDKVCQYYKSQLDAEGEKLLAIVAKSDQ